MTDPTPEETRLLFDVMTTGLACGLQRPYEWFLNYERHLVNLLPYKDIPKKQEQMQSLLAKLRRHSAGGPSEQESYDNLNDAEAATHLLNNL